MWVHITGDSLQEKRRPIAHGIHGVRFMKQNQNSGFMIFSVKTEKPTVQKKLNFLKKLTGRKNRVCLEKMNNDIIKLHNAEQKKHYQSVVFFLLISMNC